MATVITAGYAATAKIVHPSLCNLMGSFAQIQTNIRQYQKSSTILRQHRSVVSHPRKSHEFAIVGSHNDMGRNTQ